MLQLLKIKLRFEFKKVIGKNLVDIGLVKLFDLFSKSMLHN
jgi:hypothetical protein